jgi:hypothetical protein
MGKADEKQKGPGIFSKNVSGPFCWASLLLLVKS